MEDITYSDLLHIFMCLKSTYNHELDQNTLKSKEILKVIHKIDSIIKLKCSAIGHSTKDSEKYRK